MKGILKMERDMVMGFIIIQMEICIKGNGWRIRNKGKESIDIVMEIVYNVNFYTIKK